MYWIDRILTPSPVVKSEDGGDVIASGEGSKTGEQERNQQASTGAEDRTTPGIAAVKLKGVNGMNGMLGANGTARKRKADVMDEV